ncbi:MAG: NAD-dependent protein deacetylase [Phycicoccus sp.]|nr:NAD-dependent protein deacetylase [Phycicoccus sp.]
MAELSALLHGHPGTLVLSGAGMSTESGIPDYRGPDGLRRVTPMEHGEFIGSSGARQRYWARSYIGWARFRAAEPNDGHRAVALLQRRGHVGAIITQNVDGLHQRAGSIDVVELHGSLAHVGCLDCGTQIDRSTLQRALARDNPGFVDLAEGTVRDGSQVSSQIRPDGDIVLADSVVERFVQPRCPECGSDVVKPDVVFFGGSVPKDRVEQCFALTDAAPALLVLGSSLRVMSGFRFVRRAVAHGIPVAILTRGATRADPLGLLHVDAPLGTSLEALVDELARAA